MTDIHARPHRRLTVVAADDRVIVIGLNALRAFRLRRATAIVELW